MAWRTNSANDVTLSRRSLLATVLTTGALVAGSSTANAGLLDEYGADPAKITVKEVSSTTTIRKNKDGETGIDPTLRANYYYPTAKKRYLPRIQKVSSEISSIPEFLQSEKWDMVSEFADKTAENAILPLKLYQSSLDGQGLSMSNSYAKVMKGEAEKYEKKCKDLQKAVKKKDSDKALTAISEMSEALSGYRTAGRLTADIAEIPSVEDIRRGAMRRPTLVKYDTILQADNAKFGR